MRVYSGIEKIADVKVRTMDDVRCEPCHVVLRKSRWNTKAFLEKYAEKAVEFILENPEKVDQNDLTVAVGLPMFGGRALQISFTGVNMGDREYRQLQLAVLISVGEEAIEYYRQLYQRMQEGSPEYMEFKKVSQECVAAVDEARKKYDAGAVEGWDNPFIIWSGVRRNATYEQGERLLCWGTEFYKDLHLSKKQVEECDIQMLGKSTSVFLNEAQKLVAEKLVSCAEGEKILVLSIEGTGASGIFMLQRKGESISPVVNEKMQAQIRYSLATVVLNCCDLQLSESVLQELREESKRALAAVM